MITSGSIEGAYLGIKSDKLLVNIVSEKERDKAPAKSWLNINNAVAMGICEGGSTF